MAASLIPHASLYLIGTIVFTVIAGVAVLARFASRWKLRQIPLGPDWLSLISLLILFAQAALFIDLIEKYGALDLDPPSPFDAIAELVTDTWVEQFLFTSVITSVELGILWFYYILFHIDCHIRWAILVTGTVCILWLIITFILLVVLKQQSPGLLDVDNGTLPQFLFVFELINLFIDVIILCIPIRAVIGLQLPRPKKVAVFIIFLLGFLTCATSIFRILSLRIGHAPLNFSQFPIVIFAGIVQSGLAIAVSCLPTLRPILLAIGDPCIRRWREHQEEKRFARSIYNGYIQRTDWNGRAGL